MDHNAVDEKAGIQPKRVAKISRGIGRRRNWGIAERERRSRAPGLSRLSLSPSAKRECTHLEKDRWQQARGVWSLKLVTKHSERAERIE